MAEEKKKGKVHETLDETGEAIEGGLKKGWGAVKGAGKKVKDEIEGDDKKKK